MNGDGLHMADDPNIWRVVGSLESDMRAIKDLLTEANMQRREFQGDIRTAVTDLQTLIPMIRSHDAWIETDGKRVAKRVERAGYFIAGSAIASGAVGTSPAWLGKLLAALQAVLPS